MSIADTLERLVEYGPRPPDGYHVEVWMDPGAFRSLFCERIHGEDRIGLTCDEAQYLGPYGTVKILPKPGATFADFQIVPNRPPKKSLLTVLNEWMDRIAGEEP